MAFSVGVLHAIAAFAVPAAILAVAAALSAQAAIIPAAYASVAARAPEIIFTLGALLALAFQRGRIFFALLTLTVAWFAYRGYLSRGLEGFPARAVFVSLCLLVPANLMALALTPERGIFNRHGLLRVTVLVLQCGVVAWLAAAGNRETVDWLYEPLTTALPTGSPVSQSGLLLMAAGVLTGIGLWWRSRSAIDLAFAGATLAWAIAAQGVLQAQIHTVFTAAAALMLSIAILQDVYRMAFRDELTGLPARRALNEHLARLGRRYTIAMIDIDHFKKFNDTHGHDVGDQVLKMVATRIDAVRGGGSAYRFGGEEFVVVFAGTSAADAMAHLEALRIDVAQHGLTLRGPDRPPQPPSSRTRKTRSIHAGGKKLSVTISIGIAEPDAKRATPSAVLTAADKALYRAKHAGRNQVSR